MSLVVGPDMSLDVAEALVDQVKKQADAHGVRVAVTVVDRGANVVACARMDGAQLGAMSLARDKAHTAVAFQRGTGAWADSSAPGGSDWGLAGTLDGRAVVFPGGLPAFSTGDLVGGIGVSGATSDVDEACARLALEALGLESER